MIALTSSQDNCKAIFYVIPVLIFWFIAISLYFEIFSLASSLYDKKRISQLFLIFFTLLCILLSSELRRSIYTISNKNKLVIIGLLTLITLSIFSSLSSPLPIYAFTETLTFLGLAAFALTIATSFIEKPKFTITLVIVATWIFLFINVVEFLTSYLAAIIIDGKIDADLLIPHFGNIRFFNQFQIWLLPLSLTPLLLIKFDRRRIQYSLYLLVGLWTMVLIASQSRGAQLTLPLALLITYLVYREKSQRLLITSFISIGIGLSLYFLLFNLIPAMISLVSEQTIASQDLSRLITAKESSNVRVELWLKSLEYIQQNQILGIGPMHYAYYPGQHAHPHNSVLQICSEFGIPFCIVLMGLLSIFLWKWVRFSKPNRQLNNQRQSLASIHQSKLENNQQLWIILFFSLVSGLIYSLVSGVFVMPMSQTMMFIVLGLMIGLINTPSVQTASFSTLKSVSIQMIAGVLAVSLFLLILPHITTRILVPFFATYMPQHTAGPRYWELGGLIQQPAAKTSFYYEHPELRTSGLEPSDK